MKTIFVIDIDGTLSDITERVKKVSEKYYGKGYDSIEENIKNHNWTMNALKELLSEENIMSDKVIKGAENIMELSVKCNARPVILTARNEFCREATRKWLSVNLGIPNDVVLLMRQSCMYKMGTAECKEQIFREELFFVEDRNTSYVFFEDSEEALKCYSRYGLALKAPECWDIIK